MNRLRAHLGAIDRLAFAPDGRGLAAAGKAVTTWADWAAGQPVLTARFEARGVGYVGDGRRLLVAAHGLWRFRLSDAEARVLTALQRGRLAVSADGRFAAVYDGFNGRLTGWAVDADEERELWSIRTNGMHWNAGPSLTPDGTRVVAPNPNPLAAVKLPVGVWDAKTGALLAEHPMPHGSTTVVAVHPDGETIAFGSDSRLVLGSLAGGPPRVVRTDTPKHLTDVAFHPSGRWLAAASNDATVRFFDARTGAVDKTFTWNAGRVRCLAFSPDGTLAAAGTDKGNVVVWDVDE